MAEPTWKGSEYDQGRDQVWNFFRNAGSIPGKILGPWTQDAPSLGETGEAIGRHFNRAASGTRKMFGLEDDSSGPVIRRPEHNPYRPDSAFDDYERMNPGAARGAIEDWTRDKFNRERNEFLEELGVGKAQADKDFGRQRRNINEAFADRMAAINDKIGDANRDVANVNDTINTFIDRITPGFSDAVAEAEAAAAATAAIEMTFSETQGNVDAAYASSSGKVRAIAAKVGGAGSQVMAGAVEESLYEMKTFIDQQVELDRSQTVAMHVAAANIAGAAAQAEFAGAEGDVRRTQYTEQKKYEKIIRDLVRQRSAAQRAKARALRNLQENEDDWADTFQRERDKGLDKIAEGQEAILYAANSDVNYYQAAVGTVWFEELKGTEIEVPRSKHQEIQNLATWMENNGYMDFDEAIQLVDEETANLWTSPEWAKYEDHVEVLTQALRDGRDYHDTEMSSSPLSSFGAIAGEYDYLRGINLPHGEALDYTSGSDPFLNFLTGG